MPRLSITARMIIPTTIRLLKSNIFALTDNDFNMLAPGADGIIS
jgi:hypothetical protein